MKDIIISSLLGIASLGTFIAALRSIFAKRVDDSVVVQAVGEAPLFPLVVEPLCVVCGDKATEGMPYISREREEENKVTTLWMRHNDRNVYAAPPQYHRVVDPVKCLCRVHAHVADAKVDNFLYGRIRAVLAGANEQIALEAATFEKQDMLKSLEESLTPREKNDRLKKKIGNGDTKTNGIPSPLTAAPSN